MENLRKVALKHMNMFFSEQNTTFKVEVKEQIKRFPLTSREVAADIGGYILEKNGKFDSRCA